MVLRRADVVIPDYLWPSRPEVGAAGLGAAPRHPPFRSASPSTAEHRIKNKNENYHSKQLLSPFDRARHSGGIRRNYCDSFIGGRLCDSYKRHKQDHGERSMGTDHGFEADMPYPPLSPEQPLETGEDRDPLHAAIVQLPPVQARRVHAYYILSVSKKIARVEGVGISRVC